jgi:hypothetical protein
MLDRRLVLLACLAILGCSSNGGGGGGGNGGSGGGGNGGGGGGSGGSGGSGGGGGSNGDVVVIQTQEFTVAPGGEVFMCQDFANPFGGVDTEVSEIDSDMTPGSHHMLLFFQDNATDTNVASCDALQFQTLLYGAQLPQTSLPYPAGVAALIKGTQGFHMQMHYLNLSTTTALKAKVTITFHRAAPGTITQHAGVFFFNNIRGIWVPANTTKDVTASCSFMRAANIIYATAHTHHFTNSFKAETGGSIIYQTKSWDNSPLQAYAPPLQVPANQAISWTCNITNSSMDPMNVLTFGESANTNDMCIFDGQYYPADDANPTVECTIL